MRRTSLIVALISVSTASSTQEDITWQEVQPLLAERCVACHSGSGAPLALQLDSFESAIAGSSNGPVLISGDPDASELVRRIRGESQPQMPLGDDPLTPEQIGLIEAWIRNGLPQGATQAGAGAADAIPQAPPDPEPTEPSPAGQPVEAIGFARVEPIFARHCVSCHTAGGAMGEPPEGVRLDSYENVLAGGERLVVVPGNVAASEIVRRIEGLSQPAMPLGMEPLSPEDIATIRDWIAAGAPDAEGRPAPIPAGKEVRLRGILTGPAEIDGASFTLEGTDIEDEFEIGQEAEMRGQVQADGSLNATRLRAH